MEVRLLAPGDEALLARVAELFNEIALCEADAARLLADPTFVMVAALDDTREITGRIYGHVLRRLDQTDLFLYEVDVADRYHRQGVGRAMLDRLKELCRERRYGEMFVLTETSNEAGNGLYSAAGGVTEGSPANCYVFSTPKT
jgi:GNAT superfamily N-acetyltransferase